MSPWEYLLQPAILFFLLGVLAAVVKSDLEIPGSVLKILSLYLLFALGFKGGVELQKVTDPLAVAVPLLVATAASFVIPLILYPLLRRKFSVPDAAAVAATYGSVSAVTFMTAVSYLEARQTPYGGYMVAALAIMESPAILTGLLLARSKETAGFGGGPSWGSVIHECLANKSVLVLLGSLVAGMATPASGIKALTPFVSDMFPGVLCFFLLDLGLVAARRISDLKGSRAFCLGFGILFPLLSGASAVGISKLVGLTEGDAVLFTILCASASYIAVPAALRAALPAANPGLYVGLALGVTFPFNLLVGIPLAYSIIHSLWQ
jgi:uncharacterized protein